MSGEAEFHSFDWDENKNEINQRKHGIDFLQAAKALQKPRLDLPSNRSGEARTLAICPDSSRLIAVVYTMRGDICRIISARAARKNEQRAYRQIYI
ncbi:uncharacterized DUF497 family protein [Rhizobium sp. SG_E_25_P2]|uniref:BrnT family toxin n=1 Tax=Rhizobium sp. SG_E_25_P2 TaxID=2879942 RepID=UPI002475F0C9|nr:BrnT family toxin [Rhizobium sp. SG_E_25_P2]MDH6266917.1 uncharacterized DUF497 family protein [Rhizobium sp. SG_E_25_P2]